MTLNTKVLAILVLLCAWCGAPLGDALGDQLLHSLRTLSRPLVEAADLDPLLASAGDARLVLLGEASHGTHEFYLWRDRLSRRLIEEHGFSFIAIEGDWSSLLPLDRYVRHHPGAASSARAALTQIDRWPRWVWANTELEALGEWLHAFNRDRPPARRVGIHGIDLYAIWESIDAVQAFYQGRLPAMAEQVRRQYALLRDFRGDYRGYAEYVRMTGQSARAGVARVADQLAARYRHAGPGEREALFEALKHARTVEAGERYLANLARAGRYSWNVRSLHFARGVARLLDHYGPGSRAIVWAHNTHIGDGRATDMLRSGELTLGQLVRERYGRDAVFLVGLGTATGSVLAAPRWEGPRQTMQIPAPRADSLDAALLASGEGDRLLMLVPSSAATMVLRRRLPQRAIGVVFEPEREPSQNYIPTRLALRYDAFIFLPLTRALDPLPAEGG
jgi:erythromycin esterase-like protein